MDERAGRDRIYNDHLDETSDYLYTQILELRRLADKIQQPYQSQAKELRVEAQTWLQAGMSHTGRDREEDFSDALRLLELSVDNPIGRQDYVAWFQIGWLRWKAGELQAAEECFYRSQRLSEREQNVWHRKAVRHLAYIHYLRSQFEDAASTIERVLPQQALSSPEEVDIAFEAARYFAKAGDADTARDWLEAALKAQPLLSLRMFGEEDFANQRPILVTLYQEQCRLIAQQIEEPFYLVLQILQEIETLKEDQDIHDDHSRELNSAFCAVITPEEFQTKRELVAELANSQSIVGLLALKDQVQPLVQDLRKSVLKKILGRDSNMQSVINDADSNYEIKSFRMHQRIPQSQYWDNFLRKWLNSMKEAEMRRELAALEDERNLKLRMLFDQSAYYFKATSNLRKLCS